MKKQDKDEILLIVALGKTFNNTPLNKKECDAICNMSIAELISALEINVAQANLLYKWANSCSKGIISDEEDNC